MAQGEEPRHSLNRTVHCHHREGGASQREAEYGPERAYTHGHAQGRHQSEGEDTKADGGKHLKHSEQHDAPPTTQMGEVEYMIDIELVEEYQYEEDKCLRQELAKDGYHDTVISHTQPLLSSLELQLHTQRISRDEEHEEHHDTRHEDGGEIEVVISPGIGHLMEVETDGL